MAVVNIAELEDNARMLIGVALLVVTFVVYAELARRVRPSPFVSMVPGWNKYKELAICSFFSAV